MANHIERNIEEKANDIAAYKNLATLFGLIFWYDKNSNGKEPKLSESIKIVVAFINNSMNSLKKSFKNKYDENVEDYLK